MPTEIPGFYYDVSKKKYFKIQPNHIAPEGSQYSREAVNAQKITEDVDRRATEARKALESDRVVRSRVLANPLVNFDRQLGLAKKSTLEEVAEKYVLNLKPREVFRSYNGSFAICEESQTLYTTTYVSWPPSRNFSALKWSRKGLDYEDYNLAVTYLDPDPPPILFEPLSPILRDRHAMKVRAVSSQQVVYLGGDIDDHPSDLHISTKSSPDDPWRTWTWDPPWRRNSLRLQEESYIHDVAVSPNSQTCAVASIGGVWHFDLQNPIDPGPKPQHNKIKDNLSIQFLDNTVFMCGARNGLITFGDIRGGSTPRLKHASGVNAIRVLRDPNQIVVNGTEHLSIYDLRYTSNTPLRGSKTNTPPLIPIPLEPNRQPGRFGLGFDYDPELDVIAMATDFAKKRQVGLWSGRTGRLVGGSSARINACNFAWPVEGLQFARMEPGQPRSLFVAERALFECRV